MTATGYPVRRIAAAPRVVLCLAAIGAGLPATGSPAATAPAEPTVAGMVRPAGSQRQASAAATGGDGSLATPWTGWESVLDDVPRQGTTVRFSPGHYRQRRALALPVDLDGWLELLGEGATIHLTRDAPRFLDVGRTADGQTLRRIHVAGFTIDAHQIGGRHHVILGTFQDGQTLSGRCLDIDRIVVHHVSTRNVRSHPVPKEHHRSNLWLGSIDTGTGTPGCPQGEATVRNVLVEDLHLEGGNMGVVLFGSGADPSRVRLDEIHVHRVFHDLGPQPRRGYFSSNVHLGSRGHGGRAHVSRVDGRNSADVGIEVNGFLDALIENNTLENAFYAAILVRNYTDSVDVSRQRVRVRDNTVLYSTTNGGSRTKRGISISESGRYAMGSVSVESYAYYSVENQWLDAGSCLHVDLRNPGTRRIDVRGFHCSLYALDDDAGVGLRPLLLQSLVPVPVSLEDGVIELRGTYRGRPTGKIAGVEIEAPVKDRIRDVNCDFRVDAPAGIVRRCVDRSPAQPAE